MHCSTPVTSSLAQMPCSQTWHLGCNPYSMQLAIVDYNNSSVHIFLNPAYSMQGILESVDIDIMYSDIVFMSTTNITSTPEESWKHRCSDSKLSCLFPHVYALYLLYGCIHLFSFQIKFVSF